MSQWYKAKHPIDMSVSQRAAFDRSYKSYSEKYDKIKNPYESKLSKDEYFNEYKITRRYLESKDLSTKNMPSTIAANQRYERGLAEDTAKYKALKESDIFKEKFGSKVSFRKFRSIESEQLDDMLFEEIRKNKQELVKSGMSEEETNAFISQYYFGSE